MKLFKYYPISEIKDSETGSNYKTFGQFRISYIAEQSKPKRKHFYTFYFVS